MNPKRKFCVVCDKTRHVKSWTCRSCGALCCEHYCTLKAGSQATCGKCSLESTKRFMRTGKLDQPKE